MCIKSNGVPYGNSTCAQRQLWMTQTPYKSHDHTYPFTTYYNNTVPPSQLTPFSPMASLHAISDLTTLIRNWNLLLLLCIPIVTFLFAQMQRQRIRNGINTHIDQTEVIPNSLFHSIDMENEENEIIAQDIAFWTDEPINKVKEQMRNGNLDSLNDNLDWNDDESDWNDDDSEWNDDANVIDYSGYNEWLQTDNGKLAKQFMETKCNEEWPSEIANRKACQNKRKELQAKLDELNNRIQGKPPSPRMNDTATTPIQDGVTNWKSNLPKKADIQRGQRQQTTTQSTRNNTNGNNTSTTNAAITTRVRTKITIPHWKVMTRIMKMALRKGPKRNKHPTKTSTTNAVITTRVITKKETTQWNVMTQIMKTAIRTEHTPKRKNRPMTTKQNRMTTPPKAKHHGVEHQVSHMSKKKWQTQGRQLILNWTPHHMDSYLAIPQVAVEWIVEPG